MIWNEKALKRENQKALLKPAGKASGAGGAAGGEGGSLFGGGALKFYLRDC
jgi:hypothetical protein